VDCTDLDRHETRGDEVCQKGLIQYLRLHSTANRRLHLEETDTGHGLGVRRRGNLADGAQAAVGGRIVGRRKVGTRKRGERGINRLRHLHKTFGCGWIGTWRPHSKVREGAMRAK
jgi:hypothetical protein